jgi:hypothetical protein
MRIPISLDLGKKTVETKTLIDSGADELFIHEDLIKLHHIPTLELKEPIKVKNVDGTPNKKGEITHYTWIKVQVGNRTEKLRFFISNIGKDHIILGLPWLERINPIIDWAKGTVEIDDKRIQRKVGYALRKDLEVKRLATIRQEREEKQTSPQPEPPIRPLDEDEPPALLPAGGGRRRRP